MAVSGDVTIAQDAAENVKVHPYVIALVRWCVSCMWSMATVLVHRLMTTPVTPVKALKAPPPSKPTPRRAVRSSHIHPEPKVECVVLHQPEGPVEMDFVFVHGLYGSLENTWRQGDWLTKYKQVPEMVPLKNANTQTNNDSQEINKEHLVEVKRVDCCNRDDDSSLDSDKNDDSFNKIDDTEHFVQVNRVNCDINDDFKLSFNKHDDFSSNSNENYSSYSQNDVKDNFIQLTRVDDSNRNSNHNSDLNDGSCDSIQAKEHILEVNRIEDTNINFKNNFYENALESDIYITETYYAERLISDMDTETQFVSDFLQNCDLSNKTDNLDSSNDNQNDDLVCDCKLRNLDCQAGCGCVCDNCYSTCWPKDWIKVDFPGARIISVNYTSDPHLWRPLWIKGCKRLRLHERAEQMMKQLLDLGVGSRPIIWIGHSKGGLFIKQMFTEAYEAYMKESNQDEEQNNYLDTNNIEEETVDADENNDTNGQSDSIKTEISIVINKNDNNELINLEINEKEALNDNNRTKDTINLENEIKNPSFKDDTKDNVKIDDDNRKADLWLKSVGFMFYSVPHRGSPLADFKTPITARSIELLEMGKDCAVVLSLQQKWLVASNCSKALVTSIVETCKTLMSVLWLRIVSVDSADAGIGTLYGISVDHREICKPSSRSCVLYKELVDLVHNAMDRWRTQHSGSRKEE